MKEFLLTKIKGRSGGKTYFFRPIFGVLFVLPFILPGVSCTNLNITTEKLNFTEKWKFKPDDKVEYSNVEYNDSNWNSIEVSKSWQKQGYDYYGFAWYRNKFALPKAEKQSFDSIKVFLGKITDSHQVFLNGQIIGVNGKIVAGDYEVDSTFTVQPSSTRDNEYVLSIYDSRIFLGQENVLAVRVFNRRLLGGLISGDPYVKFVTVGDSIVYGRQFYRPDSMGNIDTSIIVTNLSKRKLTGVLNIRVQAMLPRKNMGHLQAPVSLRSSQSQSIPVSIPQIFTPVNVYLDFNDQQLNRVYKDSLFVPFVLYK